MDAEKHLELEEKVVAMLKTVFDPEIPVDIYSLGLVYRIDLSDDGNLTVDKVGHDHDGSLLPHGRLYP